MILIVIFMDVKLVAQKIYWEAWQQGAEENIWLKEVK